MLCFLELCYLLISLQNHLLELRLFIILPDGHLLQLLIQGGTLLSQLIDLSLIVIFLGKPFICRAYLFLQQGDLFLELDSVVLLCVLDGLQAGHQLIPLLGSASLPLL